MNPSLRTLLRALSAGVVLCGLWELAPGLAYVAFGGMVFCWTFLAEVREFLAELLESHAEAQRREGEEGGGV